MNATSVENMNSKIFQASLKAVIPRIGKTTTDFNKFTLLRETVIPKIINQAAKLKANEQYLCKMYDRNFDVFVKFAGKCESFMNFFPP